MTPFIYRKRIFCVMLALLIIYIAKLQMRFLNYAFIYVHNYTRTCKLMEMGLSPQILSQGSVEWYDARRERITASYAGAIKSLKNGKSLIERILGNTLLFTTPALQHGNFFESVVRAMTNMPITRAWLYGNVGCLSWMKLQYLEHLQTG